jgi:hypothetical protein
MIEFSHAVRLRHTMYGGPAGKTKSHDILVISPSIGLMYAHPSLITALL